MKAKMYIAPTKYAYRVAEDGQSIQFLDTSMNLGWKRSDYMTGKVFKIGRPAQEVLDEEAAQRGWQPWEEPEEQADADEAKSNAVQLAKDVLDAVRHFKGELTADGCRQAVGKSYYSHCGLDSGEFQCSPRGVKLIPRDGDFMDLTWAKFIKFCRENGLIEEKPLKAASKTVSERAKENPIHAVEDAPTCAPTVSDAQTSPPPSVGADAKTEVDADDLPEVCRGCQCVTCGNNKGCVLHCWTKPNEVSSCERIGPAGVDCKDYQPIEEESIKCNTKPAQKPAAAANMATPAAPPQAKTSTTSESEEGAEASTLKPLSPDAPTNLLAPDSPVDAGAATQNLSAAAPASLEAQPLASSAFDFGADAETNAMLLQDAQIFMAGSMARVMAAKRAHDRTAHNYRGSWGKWCELVGISRDTGDNMVRVAEQFGNIQVDGRNLIDLQPMKLLYAASKPSTPPEARAKVENLEITSSKQFQELLSRLKAKEQELASERADREAERASTSVLLADEQHRRQEALRARLEAEKAAREAKNDRAQVQRKETLARRWAEEAEKTAKEAQKNEMLQIQRARDAENQRAMMEERERFHLARIAELEARPVEVVGADPDEIERRAQILADQKTAQIQAELSKVRTEQKASDNQSVQRTAHDAVILATRSMDAAWQALAPMLPRLAPEEKIPIIYKVVNQLMCMKEEALQMIEKEKKPDADHQN